MVSPPFDQGIIRSTCNCTSGLLAGVLPQIEHLLMSNPRCPFGNRVKSRNCGLSLDSHADELQADGFGNVAEGFLTKLLQMWNAYSE